MQNSIENLACSSSFGRWWISAFGMLELVPTRTCSTSSARMPCSLIRRSISVMPGWVSEPDGCGLIETPGLAKVHGLAELAEDGALVVAAAGSIEEAARRFQDAARSRSSHRRRTALPRRRFRRTARHGTAWSWCRNSRAGRPTGCRRSTGPAAWSATSKPSSFDARGGGREGAAGRGGVKAGLVVARRDRLGDLAFDLDAEMIGEHEVAARRHSITSAMANAAGSAGAVGWVSRP